MLIQVWEFIHGFIPSLSKCLLSTHSEWEVIGAKWRCNPREYTEKQKQQWLAPSFRALARNRALGRGDWGEFDEGWGNPWGMVKHHGTSNTGEPLPPLNLKGRQEEAVPGTQSKLLTVTVAAAVGESNLTGAVAFGTGMLTHCIPARRGLGNKYHTLPPTPLTSCRWLSLIKLNPKPENKGAH